MSRSQVQRAPSSLGKLVALVLFPLTVSVIVGICVAFAIASPWLCLRRWRRRRNAMKSLASRAVFVWSSNRGWDALVRNNVLPLLDDCNVYALHRRRKKPTPEAWLYQAVQEDLHRFGCWPPVPFVASLDEKAKRFHKVTSLNATLRPLKPCGKRSVATQEAVCPILREAFREHGLSAAVRDG